MQFPRSSSARYCLSVLTLVLAACAPLPERLSVDCPVPPPPRCTPQPFTVGVIDTSDRGGKYQYGIEMLSPTVNSAMNDYALSVVPFGGKQLALITTDNLAGQRGPQYVAAADFHTTLLFGSLQRVALQRKAVFGAPVYSASDHRVYYSAKAPNADPEDYDLYSAKLVLEDSLLTLTDEIPLEGVNTLNRFESQPALSLDGKTIYFVTDRGGSAGGTDIWLARRESITSNAWSSPVPLSIVNTACDEITPCISSDGKKLYFSSSGHENIGGFDLFEVTLEHGEPTGAVRNMGRGINSRADDFFPYSMNDTAFFFASSRAATRDGVNLYTLTRTRIVRTVASWGVPQAESRPETQLAPITPPSDIASRSDSVRLTGRVTRGQAGYAATEGDIFVLRPNSEEEVARQRLSKGGEFDITLERGIYDVGAESADAFYDLERVDLRSGKDSLTTLTLHLPDTLVLRINFPFDDYSNPYDFIIGDAGDTTSITWSNSLDRAAHAILRSRNLVRVVLIGHTDSLGSDEYNDRLGRNRAQFVANELVKRKVPKSLLTVDTRGRRSPVNRREFETDEVFRLRSRRVEFIKIFKR